MVLLPKKKVIITLAVLTAILAIVIMVFALLKASNDKKELARLKTSIAMTLLHEAKPKFLKGRTNPPSSGLGYQIGIEFANGSYYSIFGYGDKYEVVITSSDMDESIFYKCTKEQMYAMADMMASLNSAIDFGDL